MDQYQWSSDATMISGTEFISSIDTITIAGAAAQPIISIGDDYFAIPVNQSQISEIDSRLAKLEAAMLEEQELRNQHPALKQAYDEYRLLLVLAKSHSNPNLTDN